MSRVTSKLQITVPKAVAEQCGIRPGDEISWVPAGDTVRIVPAAKPPPDPRARLALFDAATRRQKARQAARAAAVPAERGWTREDLYDRGRAR